MKTITLYTRERCHLCDVAHEALERARLAVPFELVVVVLDHEAPDDKRAAYDWDVPVVELDGRKVMKHHIDEARLLRLIREDVS